MKNSNHRRSLLFIFRIAEAGSQENHRRYFRKIPVIGPQERIRLLVRHIICAHKKQIATGG
jgi:hypothetical protein